MQISANEVKQLHLETGAGYMDAKRALEQSGGDAAQAKRTLRLQGAAIASQKINRIAKQGRIEIYQHTGERIGVMLELNCESDFAAATQTFQALAHNLAMHIAAMNPACIAPEDIPPDVLLQETRICEQQARLEHKPEALIPVIVEGKLKKYYQSQCLLEQPYVLDDQRSVRDELTASIAALKENIVIKRFVRYEVGA